MMSKATRREFLTCMCLLTPALCSGSTLGTVDALATKPLVDLSGLSAGEWELLSIANGSKVLNRYLYPKGYFPVPSLLNRNEWADLSARRSLLNRVSSSKKVFICTVPRRQSKHSHIMWCAEKL